MRQLTMSSLIVLPLALAACGGGAANKAAAGPVADNAANSAGAPGNAAAASFNGAAPVAGVTREFLTGSWGSDGACDVPAATYAPDGTMDGGRRWALDGDRLIVTRGTERQQSVVERLGDDRIRLNTADGPFELTRCPAH